MEYNGLDDFGEKSKEQIKEGLNSAGRQASNIGGKALTKGSDAAIKSFKTAGRTAGDSVKNAISAGTAPSGLAGTGAGSLTGSAGMSVGAGTVGVGAGGAVRPLVLVQVLVQVQPPEPVWLQEWRLPRLHPRLPRQQLRLLQRLRLRRPILSAG